MHFLKGATNKGVIPPPHPGIPKRWRTGGSQQLPPPNISTLQLPNWEEHKGRNSESSNSWLGAECIMAMGEGGGMRSLHHRDWALLQEGETDPSFPKWIHNNHVDLLCPYQSKGKDNCREMSGQKEALPPTSAWFTEH